jgi:alcohol/geraniol dehydrogenase (NADP+)
MLVEAYAAIAAKKALTLQQLDLGPLGPNEVDIRVTHCGICHTDVGMVDNEWGFSNYPLAPGHEIVGTVAAVGVNVIGLEIGQRVGLGALCGSCMTCEYCERGAQHVCADAVGTIFGHHGGFATHVRAADWRFAFPLPDAIRSEHAGPLMCAGSTVFAPFVHYGVRPTDRVAIVGIGGLGHLALQYAAKWGCQVTAISTTPDKRDEARCFGAHHFVSSGEQGALGKMRGAFDFILSTVAVDLPWSDYIAALRPQGTLCIVGTSPSPVPVGLYDLLSGERSVVGGKTGALDDTRQMLAFTARHGITPMIEVFPMSEATIALDRTRQGKVRYRAVLVA